MHRLWEPLYEQGFVEEVHRFGETYIAPVADELDAQDRYPSGVISEAASRGYTTITIDPMYGGEGGSMSKALASMEELSYFSGIVGISLITIFQTASIIEAHGVQSLRERYLPRYGEGLRGAYALTESKSGSDIRSLETQATPSANGWTIRGEKSFITSGSEADLFVVLAQAPSGVSAFAVPRGAPGVDTYEGPNAQTFGLRNGPHVNLTLNDVTVPPDHLIGEEGKGISHALGTLARSRTLAAGISLGIARAAFDGALAFASRREAFDQNVLDFQGIQWYFADLVTEIDAARLLTYKAAEELDAGRNIAKISSEAKLLASGLATRTASTAVQVCGARGTMTASPFGRYLRDAKAYEIAGGSSEILRNTIGKTLVKYCASLDDGGEEDVT